MILDFFRAVLGVTPPAANTCDTCRFDFTSGSRRCMAHADAYARDAGTRLYVARWRALHMEGGKVKPDAVACAAWRRR